MGCNNCKGKCNMSKLPLITGGFMNVTQRCNLKCTYCFVVQQHKEITWEVAKDAADFYARNAETTNRENGGNIIPEITFFGGEPMLRYEDIVKPLVEYIRNKYGNEYSLGITTNGTLLNEERLKFFSDNNVGMLLSLDGARTCQNINRPYHNGKGSFDDIPIKTYLKYFPNGTFRATIDPSTVHYMYENFIWGEDIGYTNASFIPNVFAEWDDDKVQIFKDQCFMILNHIKHRIENNMNYMEFNIIRDGMEDLKQIENLSINSFRPNGVDMLACGRCGLAAGGYASVGSNGDLYSCQEMTENPEWSDFIIGNIYTGVDDEKRYSLASSFHTHNVKCEDETMCETCKLKNICNGGCVINNFFKTGKLDRISKFFCIAQQTGIELAMEMRNLNI